ncbi:DUF4013 domain-containing protein [Methanobacterium petrolearium]|uniref:DUF4013 domain-containing protein n=1 Tax=Methanobacterium petrolearium TaxID=710190 RepID=UPI001AE9B950|nr:DUF4013 domain-containing protein [Methanobacterium petrolearium]MBP1947066.1 hypothetical protein [Methanobacterium petrolearium]BDZ69711.1 hypothetical protein GCM10025861_02280 [Methanobacterium petrolearium]
MEIGEIISNSLSYPSQDWKKLLILGILFLISFLIIPAFLVMGYFFRILKGSIAGFDELPDFDEWGEMFIDGLKLFIVQFVYFLIPAIIILIGVWASFASLYTVGTVTDTTAFLGLMGGTAIIGIILAIILGLIATIAIANMALNNGELGAAFRFSEILEQISMIGWGKYIVWYIVMIIVGFIGGIIASILGFIPFLGTIIALLVVYPYLYMFSARSLALLYGSSVDVGVVE